MYQTAFAQRIPVDYQSYSIDGQVKKDTSMLNFLAVYKDSLSKTMNQVIGFSLNGLYKKQPESGLGNFMADAIKEIGQEVFKEKIDAAFVNFGGVRSYFPKGDITVGHVFELMPFDNLLVLQHVRGDSLLSFMNHIAKKNGWPVSGVTMTIKDSRAANVLINNQPIVADNIYVIANSDYIANGGDDTKMLKSFKLTSKGYLIRDALLTYTKRLTEKGESIDVKLQKRIVYEH